jgi:hypothetical protein
MGNRIGQIMRNKIDAFMKWRNNEIIKLIGDFTCYTEDERGRILDELTEEDIIEEFTLLKDLNIKDLACDCLTYPLCKFSFCHSCKYREEDPKSTKTIIMVKLRSVIGTNLVSINKYIGVENIRCARDWFFKDLNLESDFSVDNIKPPIKVYRKLVINRRE